MSIFDTKHPHYKIHKDYAQACFADHDNLPVIQYKNSDRTIWSDISTPKWLVDVEYRFALNKVTRTITYPQPLKTEPKKFTNIWIVESTSAAPVLYQWCYSYSNPNYTYDRQQQALRNGMVFATEEDAQLCYNALYTKVNNYYDDQKAASIITRIVLTDQQQEGLRCKTEVFIPGVQTQDGIKKY